MLPASRPPASISRPLSISGWSRSDQSNALPVPPRAFLLPLSISMKSAGKLNISMNVQGDACEKALMTRALIDPAKTSRSEERRVGKEGRRRWAQTAEKRRREEVLVG